MSLLRTLPRFVVTALIPLSVGATDIVSNTKIEANLHYRDSESLTFPVRFPPGAQLKTVDEGSSTELSRLTWYQDVAFGTDLRLHSKIDFFDLYERNPTSEDKEHDIDELWLRWGPEYKSYELPEERSFYVKAGKMGRFERQNDRHLESYGLLSTAFNRLEDLGIEAGVDLGPHLYAKASLTSGNPVFMRDPNVLAGDNGTRRAIAGNPELESGFPFLYDAEVEDLDWHPDYLETAVGLGGRIGSLQEGWVLNALAFANQRKLRDSAELYGTEYGGDLDLLDAPALQTTPTVAVLPDGSQVLNGVDDDNKTEVGLNLWLYYKRSTLFAQLIRQRLAGLERNGYEVEASHRLQIDNPWMIAGQPALNSVRLVVRYSALNNEFAGPATFPAPSLFWDWRKLDYGVRVRLYEGVKLDIEHNENRLERAGEWENYGETLVTLTLSHQF